MENNTLRKGPNPSAGDLERPCVPVVGHGPRAQSTPLHTPTLDWLIDWLIPLQRVTRPPLAPPPATSWIFPQLNKLCSPKKSRIEHTSVEEILIRILSFGPLSIRIQGYVINFENNILNSFRGKLFCFLFTCVDPDPQSSWIRIHFRSGSTTLEHTQGQYFLVVVEIFYLEHGLEEAAQDDEEEDGGGLYPIQDLQICQLCLYSM